MPNDMIVFSARLHGLERAREKLRHGSKRLYPIAREESGKALRRIYLPELKSETPVGRHWSSPQEHPYRDGQWRPGGGLRSALYVEEMTTSQTLARVRIRNTVDRWGMSAPEKADLVISGRQRRYRIVPEGDMLAFLWENAPAELLLRQRGNPEKRNKTASYPATLVFFGPAGVRAGRYKANKFHERAFNNVKEQLREGVADAVRNKIIYELR